MKKYLVGFWYSLPVQLFLLHFRKYQVFLIFWYILFATIGGHFMKAYGAYSLYLAPEYLGQVNALSSVFVGVAIGVFIMSWNITTFILYGRLIKFLATTSQPFLKYCINNAIIPIIFLLFYLVKAIEFDASEELLKPFDIAWLISGFIIGFGSAVLIGFVYFFTADRSIYKSYASMMKDARKQYQDSLKNHPLPAHRNEFRVEWYFTARFGLRKPRDVRHYSEEFLDAIFKRHHLAAVFAILSAFISLLVIGFFSDKSYFQIPAAASITIFFAILIAASGAISVFLRSWSIAALVMTYAVFNFMYAKGIFDPRNKAYGLDYTLTNTSPTYNRSTVDSLANLANIQADRKYYLQILDNWKKQQKEEKPVMLIINVSGGGTRSATFTVNTLQKLDSILGGKLMQHTILINGASGGMLGAAYYRELYLRKIQGSPLQLDSSEFASDIAKDLLNPLFSSFVARDILGPVQKFSFNGNKYIKDRGYAFEQKLNENTRGVLDKELKDYAAPEAQGIIPSILFNSVITRDGRKLIIATHPVRFLMRPAIDSLHSNLYGTDGVDFNSLFAKQGAEHIRILSALRMNATFPYVLPDVWLPTNPIIDVMDAGLRDNYGQETSVRFVETFKPWLQQNTSKVVLIQIRDRSTSDWNKSPEENNILDWLTKPFLSLQDNIFNLQDYSQQDQLAELTKSYGPQFHVAGFEYVSAKQGNPAGLSFHLTTAEKKDIAASLGNAINVKAFREIKKLMGQ